MAHYIFSINNQSGNSQSYAVFAEQPRIQHTGGSEVDVSSRFISCVHAVPSSQGQATIILPKTYYATCGVYDIDWEPTDRNGREGRRITSGTEVIDNRKVDLTLADENGQTVPGSVLSVDCKDGTPAFAKSPLSIASTTVAQDACFAVCTSGNFTYQVAKSNNFFIGFTSSLRHSIGAHAMWIPEPGQTYQVSPSTTFYVAVSDSEPSDPVLPAHKQKPTCKVDFGELARDHVLLVHRSNGSLVIQVATEQPGGFTSTANSVVKPSGIQPASSEGGGVNGVVNGV